MTDGFNKSIRRALDRFFTLYGHRRTNEVPDIWTDGKIPKDAQWDEVLWGKDLSQLQYGVSVTDACIDWATTEQSVRSMRDKLKDVLPRRPRLQR